jgi:hypothetical protein
MQYLSDNFQQKVFFSAICIYSTHAKTVVFVRTMVVVARQSSAATLSSATTTSGESICDDIDGDATTFNLVSVL